MLSDQETNPYHVDNYEPGISRSKFIWICLIFTAVLSIISWLLIFFIKNENVFLELLAGENLIKQILIGTIYGGLVAFLILLIYKIKTFQHVKMFFSELIREIPFKTYDIFIISFCAGFSEELLFRATIQPWLGIWLTSVLFIALHGYLSPFNWRLSIIGLIMVLVSAGLGYLYQDLGLLSAMTAHAVFDMVMLYYFIKVLNVNDHPIQVEEDVSHEISN